MAESPVPVPPGGASPASQAVPERPAAAAPAPGDGTYELIRQRLKAQAGLIRERMSQLDARRQEVFGRVEFKLLQADRITTAHNCVPRDMIPLGAGRFLFGFNVQFGLKKEVELGDVFAIYERDPATGSFRETTLEPLQDRQFITDFKRLYNVYTRTFFSKFSLIDGMLYMVFQVGTGAGDIAAFKWSTQGGLLRFVDGRGESEYRKVAFPPQHDFRWQTPDRESFRYGDHPHVSIEDRVFVECVRGDLTIKVEDNTASGEGIYAEPVDDPHQKVDDAEIAYAILDHLILLRIKPYKETAARHFIFNEKQQSVVRVDSLGQSCARLPEDHGLIFPDGYYLATGELKLFESRERGMSMERIVHSPNGEDSLFVFYNPETGEHVLMPYRLIAQKVEERLSCHGFSLFPDGHLLLFRADAEPQKHHQVQLRQTPFYQRGHEPAGDRQAFLYQVGNKEVVRCLAECTELLTLVGKEHPYAELYADLVKRCGGMLDAHPWLSTADGFGLDEALRQMREAADKAVDEFDKVRRLQREAVRRVTEARARCEERFGLVRRASFNTLDDFVKNLTGLRQLRGELTTLREVRYVDLAQIAPLEQAVSDRTAELSRACVQFLLKPAALDPYRQRAAGHESAVGQITKVADGRSLEKAVSEAGAELEMLIEIINGLRIEDATEATRIIDGITAIYATLNQVRTSLRKRLQDLAASEGAAQFAAQMKLLTQSAASYLDLCTTPAKCDDYLNRISVQLEEMEGTFADFDEYTVPLSEKRTALYEAFEQRKLALVEQRNRKASALMTAAERILKVIQSRLNGCGTVEEINAFVASDLMIAKVRELIAQLLELEDSVKADDLQGRLKSIQQDAVRQLKDRQELFVDGSAVIRLGRHRFNTNTQPLDLTVVLRDDHPHLHLTSTKYFEAIEDPEFLATRDVWDQEVVSETARVYRGEYLAWQLFRSLEPDNGGPPPSTATLRPAGSPGLAGVLSMTAEQRLALVQEFMGSRHADGYMKGVHDVDAARILEALAGAHLGLQLARHHPSARACALLYWHRFCPPETRTLWTAKLRGFAERNRVFPGETAQRDYIGALGKLVAAHLDETHLFPRDIADPAGEYLFFELTSGDSFVVSSEVETLATGFRGHLAGRGAETAFADARRNLAGHPVSDVELVRDWARGFLLDRPDASRHLDELTAVLVCDGEFKRSVVRAGASAILEGMKGAHPVLPGSRYRFDYFDFRERIRRHETEVTLRFQRYHLLKQQLLERERARLRLEEFKPKVLGSFVRNQLIDQIYLPLIGDNLARQIGAAGDARRTDLMGLLLLISPPGYGKTTLMEYVASRLGIVFIKINGPALGHGVTSLDPEDAPNAAAREEIQRLNLALEMGDNAMICVDDIQHCHPEFLQKFISLCDGQRKMEGVWRGKPRTYDLRGRKVVVVMAGNPYTESGQKFKVPDMLANRADTYNLGDVIGGSAEWFKASYLENAVTSNPVLAPLANKSQKDIRTFIRMADTGAGDDVTFEGSYTAQEVEEILAVMKRLLTVREIVLRVNLEYIHSAAQADEFRTEPPFRLQGSYRNMNRMAGKVVPIMNEGELRTLVIDHYRAESQTLTTGAEANLLKFKELFGVLTPDEAARWEEIRQTFRRNQVTRGADANDPMGRVVAQLSAFQQGVEGIRAALARQADRPAAPIVVDLAPVGRGIESLRDALEGLGRTQTPSENPTASAGPTGLSTQLGEGLRALREDLSRAITAVHSGTMAEKVESLSHELEMIHSTLATLKDVVAQQRDHLRNAQELLAVRAKQGTVEIELTQEMLTNERAFLDHFHRVLSETHREPEQPASTPPPIPPLPDGKP